MASFDSRFTKYLATGDYESAQDSAPVPVAAPVKNKSALTMEGVVAQDAAEKYLALDAAPIDLAAHDKRFHPHGFDPEKDRCEFREKQKKGDKADSSVPPASADGNKKPREREYDEVVAKYKGTDKWLTAPNGEPTNLTERQWVQVRTPSFKAWFGDWEKDPANASKVIDANGEPMVVYHETDWKPSKRNGAFKRDLSGYDGMFFFSIAPSRKGLEFGKFCHKLFLNIRNPVMQKTQTYNGLRDYDETRNDGSINIFTHRFGIDGDHKLEPVNGKVLGCKMPNQIKSAIDNSGAFSPEKENIMDGAADAPRKTSLRDIAAAALAEDR